MKSCIQNAKETTFQLIMILKKIRHRQTPPDFLGLSYLL